MWKSWLGQLYNQIYIKANSIINTRTSIDHDCVIGENVHIAPGAILCGNVSVKKRAFVGAAACIMPPRLTIGVDAIVGAGTTVLDNVPAGSTTMEIDRIRSFREMPFEEKILDVCVLKETSVHQVVKVLEASTSKMCLVVSRIGSSNKLLGTITDGDVRRAILDGKDLSIEGCSAIMVRILILLRAS